MSTSKLVKGLAVAVAVLALAAPAVAAPAPGTSGASVTATGTAQTRVKPKDRHSNSSIVAAVAAAQKAGVKRAIADAKEYAESYATAAGLKLGSIISVSDNVSTGFPYGISASQGPFGPNQYCGTFHPVRVKFVKKHGHKVVKIVHLKAVHRCFVPSFEQTTLAVTWSAS